MTRAVPIGTRHGMYQSSDRAALDFSRLAAIRRCCRRPHFALHGASAVPADLVAKAKKYGAVMRELAASDAQLTKAIAHGHFQSEH